MTAARKSSPARPLPAASWLLGTIVIAAALAIGWYLASPRYALSQVVAAAIAADRPAFNQYVDTAQVRVNAKSQLREMLHGELREQGAPQAVQSAGVAIGSWIGGAAVDWLMTDDAMMEAISTMATDKSSREAGDRLVIDREGISAFAVRAEGAPGSLRFERDGLGWKLVAIDPDDD